MHHAIKYPNIKQEIIKILKKGRKVVFLESNVETMSLFLIK